jgi:hypothetical protein
MRYVAAPSSPRWPPQPDRTRPRSRRAQPPATQRAPRGGPWRAPPSTRPLLERDASGGTSSCDRTRDGNPRQRWRGPCGVDALRPAAHGWAGPSWAHAHALISQAVSTFGPKGEQRALQFLTDRDAHIAAFVRDIGWLTVARSDEQMTDVTFAYLTYCNSYRPEAA